MKDEIRLLKVYAKDLIERDPVKDFESDREIEICAVVRYVKSRTNSDMWNVFDILLLAKNELSLHGNRNVIKRFVSAEQ
jgi:hypothetical protein